MAKPNAEKKISEITKRRYEAESCLDRLEEERYDFIDERVEAARKTATVEADAKYAKQIAAVRTLVNEISVELTAAQVAHGSKTARVGTVVYEKKYSGGFGRWTRKFLYTGRTGLIDVYTPSTVLPRNKNYWLTYGDEIVIVRKKDGTPSKLVEKMRDDWTTVPPTT